MKLTSSVVAAALVAASPAFAGPIFLVDFEKDWDYVFGDVNGYYAGGTAADGTSGPNLGVSFSGVSGLSNDANFTYYSNAPSPQGIAYAFGFLPMDRSFMNVAAGVDNMLSFFYASSENVLGAVTAYSGLNGTGTLLGSLDLSSNVSSSSLIYDNWTPVTFMFNGTATSFDLTGSANRNIGFDNIASIAVTAIPEPGSLLLMLTGCIAAFLLGRRQNRGNRQQP